MRGETQRSRDFRDLIFSFLMPYDLKLKIARVFDIIVAEAYAAGKIDGTKETCDMVEKKLNL